jgi:Flp pilus assembly protein TadD
VALNKARTSVWMKAFIIFLIVAFISVFMASGVAGIFELFKTTDTTSSSSTGDSLATINQRGQSAVDALTTLAASQPASYTAQVNVANAYFDWAQELSTPAAGQSQLTTAAMTAAIDTWTKARSAYDAATKLNKAFDPNVQTDRAISTFYSNDATSAIVLARVVVKQQPTFSPAWLNLGMFYDATGQNDLALAAFLKYLKLDPNGASASYATTRVKALGGSVPATATP